MKYQMRIAIRPNPTTPPTAPPAMAPTLDGVDSLVVGVGLMGSGGFTGGGGGGGAIETTCVVRSGGLVTLTVPAFELLSFVSSEFRELELMLAIAVSALFLSFVTTVVSTCTTLPLDKSLLKTAGIDELYVYSTLQAPHVVGFRLTLLHPPHPASLATALINVVKLNV